MSEKVLGFEEKDTEIYYDKEGKWFRLNLNENKLVPVVSKEEYEKQIKKKYKEVYDDGFEAGQISKEIKKQTKEYVEGIQQNVHGYIPKNKGVSIKWLEEYCFENGMVCMSCGSVTCALCQKDLLKAVRKKAGEGK